MPTENVSTHGKRQEWHVASADQPPSRAEGLLAAADTFPVLFLPDRLWKRHLSQRQATVTGRGGTRRVDLLSRGLPRSAEVSRGHQRSKKPVSRLRPGQWVSVSDGEERLLNDSVKSSPLGVGNRQTLHIWRASQLTQSELQRSANGILIIAP